LKPAAFEYHRPATLEEAVEILARVAPDEGRVLAGGQTLIPAMALRLARPPHLVDINQVAGLDRLEWRDGHLRIGACVRHARMGPENVGGPLGKLLGMVREHIAHHPIRYRGTFCGSLANADPASEWCLTSVALDAILTARSVRGSRTIAADQFVLDYMTTALEADEILVEAAIPDLDPQTQVGFYEFSRRAGDFAQVMALSTYQLEKGLIAHPRVAVGAVEIRSRRFKAAESALVGKAPSEETFLEAARAAADECVPIDDAEDARRLVHTAVHRSLRVAANERIEA
jgi:carbon-monoxide dehydrogenase medium subunit